MKQRVADFIADYLVQNNITQIFSVVGGGAMHLNNAFAINNRLNVLYNHHEQASAIAAESYSRINNHIAAVCVTSGPGGTNALTGVLCAWQDSVPMLVISGQVRYDITVESTGLDLRQFGEQEYYIVRSAAPMTKYAVMVNDAKMIKQCLGKAIYLANTGRRGPCWIDVPLNIQGQIIETDDLPEYVPESSSTVSDDTINTVIHEIQNAKKPVIIAGSGIRASGALNDFYTLIEKLKLPVICPTSIVDLFSLSDKFYYGMFGTFGGRMGNFIVQNADLLIVLGCRLSFKQIGFNFKNFSPNSKKIVVDADSNELKKPTVKIDIPVCADVANIINALNERNFDCGLNEKKTWLNYCDFLKKNFCDEKRAKKNTISAYEFSDIFFRKLSQNAIIVLGNNCAAVSMLQCGIKVRGQRLYGNVNCGTMGYDIPAAIGASVAFGSTVYCATGDGSFQMNLQELQTIVHNNLPVKMVIFNNNSYQAIVQTHMNFFNGVLAGCTNSSGISFPSFEKLSYVYNFPFRRVSARVELEDAVNWLIQTEGRAMLELVQSETDPITPKLSSKKLPDGTMISPPIDDIAPFLTPDEYERCQYKNFVEGTDNA
jgi:acetolactate synthase-1/2/3 large subunit